MATVLKDNKVNVGPAVIYNGKIIPGKSAEIKGSLNIADGRWILNPEQLQHIVVLRHEDDPKNGYQRKLSVKRVEEIIKDLKNKTESDYPEIRVANVNGVYQCYDGQHRLSSHIQANVPLAVDIRTMGQKRAIELFLRDNCKARPLMRRDQIYASRTPKCKFLKQLSIDYGITPLYASQLMMGLTNETKFSVALNAPTPFTPEVEEAARIILDIWTSDSRWVDWNNGTTERDTKRKGNLPSADAAFNSSSTIFALGRVARDILKYEEGPYKAKIKTDIKIVQSANWDKAGVNTLRGMQGSSNYNKNALVNFMIRNIITPARR